MRRILGVVAAALLLCGERLCWMTGRSFTVSARNQGPSDRRR
jgi:hypothetical protein